MSGKQIKKLIRLPKSPNGRRRKSTSFGTWKWQQARLTQLARRNNMTRSAFLNTLLSKHWMDK